MTSCYHKKNEVPPRPGTYWVHNLDPITRGTRIEMHHSDSGFARWDGTKWDRDDWDCWYYEGRESAFPTGSMTCLPRS